ncbi:MAG: ATP-binding protein [Spirochaetaceae bacterium]|nr:ATP-binding protein [Spirochaetaceae bacterium]
MKELRLHGMAGAFQKSIESGGSDKFTIDEFLTHLVDAEWNDRKERKRERLTRAAGFRYRSSMAELDYTEKRNLDKNLMLRLSDCRWITQGKDISHRDRSSGLRPCGTTLATVVARAKKIPNNYVL